MWGRWGYSGAATTPRVRTQRRRPQTTEKLAAAFPPRRNDFLGQPQRYGAPRHRPAHWALSGDPSRPGRPRAPVRPGREQLRLLPLRLRRGAGDAERHRGRAAAATPGARRTDGAAGTAVVEERAPPPPPRSPRLVVGGETEPRGSHPAFGREPPTLDSWALSKPCYSLERNPRWCGWGLSPRPLQKMTPPQGTGVTTAHTVSSTPGGGGRGGRPLPWYGPGVGGSHGGLPGDGQRQPRLVQEAGDQPAVLPVRDGEVPPPGGPGDGDHRLRGAKRWAGRGFRIHTNKAAVCMSEATYFTNTYRCADSTNMQIQT